MLMSLHKQMLGTVVLAACCLNIGCSKTPSTSAPGVSKVSVVVSEKKSTRDFDEFVGRTEATETVEVRSRVSGFIKSVEFKDGDRVKNGDLLFRIEPDAYEAIHQQSLSRIELWKAKRDLAQSKLARSKTLYDIKAISDEEYDEAVSAVKESEASIVAAEADARRTALDVKYTEVRAEIEGRIDRAYVTPGNMVTGGLGSGTLLSRIVKNSPIYAYVDIDERSLLRYLRQYTANQAANISEVRSLRDQNIPCYLQLGDEKGFPHVGTLDFIENRVDAATGTIRVRAIFENADGLLTGGLFVRLRVPVSEPYDAIMVPEQSIATDQGSKYVWVIDADKKPQRRVVELGNLRGEWRIVKSGVQAGEQVVFRGLQRVRPNVAVDLEVESGPVQNEELSSSAAQANEASDADAKSSEPTSPSTTSSN